MEATLDRNELAHRLIDLTGDLHSAENDCLKANRILAHAKEALADAEARLLLSEEITGKNAEARAAQLRQMTATERLAVQRAQEDAAFFAVHLRTLQTEHAGLRSVARLLAGEND